MRKLNEDHKVWYEDGSTKMSVTLKRLAKAVKAFEKAGCFVQSAEIQQYTEGDVVYYTGIIVVDSSFPVLA